MISFAHPCTALALWGTWKRYREEGETNVNDRRLVTVAHNIAHVHLP